MMSIEVKEELGRVTCESASARKAEVAALLRCGGGLRILNGRLVVEAQVDLASTVGRLRTDLGQLFAASAEAYTYRTAGRPVFVVRVSKDAEVVGRQAGLLDRAGRPIRGLAPQVVAGNAPDLEAAWRGAFLATGSLRAPGRPTTMSVQCPGPESGAALVGAARRLGANARFRQLRGRDLVVVTDPHSIGVLLTRMGAERAWGAWEQRHLSRSDPASADPGLNLGQHNVRRAENAAAITTVRVARALEILTDDPLAPQFAEAARVRLAYPNASLEELGRLAHPVMTKDTVAGRIRRLIARADREAARRGVPDTRSSIGAGARGTAQSSDLHAGRARWPSSA